jgi:hypothetical protein
VAHAQRLTRQQVCEALAARLTARLGGKVWARYDERRRAYCIRGVLPSDNPVIGQWTLLDYLPPSRARDIATGGV